MKQILVLLATGGLWFGISSCSNAPTDPGATAMLAHSVNGAAGQMPAFYDDEVFIVNTKEEPENATENLAKNQSLTEIYTTKDLDEEQDFFPVLDAIPGDAFNPLWEQILIVFNPGFAPHQFTNEEDVEAAAEGANPEITLIDTEEIYRCSVVAKP